MKNTILKILRVMLESTLFIGIFGVLAVCLDITAPGVFFEKFVFFCGVGIALVLLWLSRSWMLGRVVLVRTPVELFLMLILVSFGVSTILSNNILGGAWGGYRDPFTGFLGMVGLSIFSLLLATLYSHFVFRTISVACVTAGSVVALGFFGVGPWSCDAYGAGTTFAVIFSGVLFSIAFLSEPLARGFFQGVAHKIWLIVVGVSLLVSCVALAMTIDSTLWISALAGLGIFALFAFSGYVPTSPRSLGAIAFVALFLIGGFFFSGMIPEDDFRAPSLDFTMSWEVAKRSLLDRPIFGYGPGEYAEAYALYATLDSTRLDLVGARPIVGAGVVWDWSVTLGLVGIFAFLGLLGSVVGVVWHELRRSGKQMDNRDLLSFLSVLAGVTPILLFVEYNGTILFLFFLCVGGLMGAIAHRFTGKSVEWETRIRSKYLPVLLITLAFGVATIGFFGFSVGRMSVAGYVAQAGLLAESPQGAIEKFLIATQLSPKQSEYFVRLAEAYVASAVLHSLEGKENISRLEELYNNAFLAGAEAERLSPGDILVADSMARVYESASVTIPESRKWAIDQYATLERMEPASPIHPFRRGVLLFREATEGNLGEEEKQRVLRESVVAFRDAISKGENFPSAYYALSVSYRELKNFNEAKKSIDRALELAPNDLETMLMAIALYFDDENKQGRVEALLRRVNAQAPENTAVLLHSGRFYAKRGDKERARASYEKAKQSLSEEDVDVATNIDALIGSLDEPKEASLPQESVQQTPISQEQKQQEISTPTEVSAVKASDSTAQEAKDETSSEIAENIQDVKEKEEPEEISTTKKDPEEPISLDGT